ncbi:MAG: acyl-CoA synthetase [Nitrospinota bacterium]
MGNWEVPLPPKYLKVPPTFNMAQAICDRWLGEGRETETVLVYGREGMTFKELHGRMQRCARGLLELGIGRGQTFVIRSRNQPDYVVAVLAGLRIGAIPVLSNSLLGPKELRHVIENSDARAVLTTEDRIEAVEEVRADCPALRHVVLFNGERKGAIPFDSLLSMEPADVDEVETSPGDRAFMLYTSGTTGLPKGIVHVHRWLVGTGDPVGNLMLKLRPDDLSWHPSEFSFMYSWGHGLMHCLYMGTPIFIHPERFHPADAFRVIAEHQITVFSTVPTAYRMMLAVKGVEKKYDLSRLRLCVSSGETLPPETYHEWKARFGCDILDGIGVSECQKFCCNLDGEPIKPGSAGKTIPGYVLEMHDDEGKPVPTGEIGLVALREDCPGLFVEYRKMPEKWTENHINGWYYTGDLAYFDEDGYFWYVSRRDDLIKSRGYLISPKEVEETCMEHPGVLEAGVIGIPDATTGYRVKAYVVLKPGMEAGEAMAREIWDLLRERIAPYKVPKIIEFLPALPKTATGKIRRTQLRESSGMGTSEGLLFTF